MIADGKIVAAAQEERFTRIKHDARFPSRPMAYVLGAVGITPAELDHVVLYEKPLLKFDRLLETHLAYAPFGWRAFLQAMPVWLKTKLHLPREIRRSACSTARCLLLRVQGQLGRIQAHGPRALW